MSRTLRKFKGKEYPEKSRKKPKDKKHFGFTSGTHSQFENAKKIIKEELENSEIDDPMREIKERKWDRIKNKTYPVVKVDFLKYGYGNGTKKENRSKGYKKEK